MSERFWEKPIETLDRGEWEALCDGCGKCCMHKIEDDETGRIYDTNVACRLLDLETARCSDYRRRRFLVPDCIRLSRAKIDRFPWLPGTCAYRLRAEGKPLFDWHYLISGSRESVHAAGVSIRGRAISENDAGPLENHVLED